MPGTRASKTIRLSAIHTQLSNDKPGDQKTEPQKEPTTENRDFTPEQLKAVWQQFAETKKAYVAEYHLLSQPYELNGTTITLFLHNPVEETLLQNLRSDLVAFLRTQLGNQAIQVMGEMRTIEETGILYTNREKFEHLAKKNPLLKELKDRLGLETDF